MGMSLDEIKKDDGLLNAIDWEMTPEEAVTLYLEWGNNWAHGNYVIRSSNDVAHYFVVYNWDETPIINLIRRNSQESVELAAIEMPGELAHNFLNEVGHTKGVFALPEPVKNWLKRQLEVN